MNILGSAPSRIRHTLAVFIIIAIAIFCVLRSAAFPTEARAGGIAITTVSSTAPPGTDFAASSDGSVVAYEASDYVYVWEGGHTNLIGRSLGGRVGAGETVGLSLSSDGKVLAYTSRVRGHRGITFVNLTDHQRTFLSGYQLGASIFSTNAPVMSSNGRYVLVARATSDSWSEIYDRKLKRFQRLPGRHGSIVSAHSISADGRVVVYGEAEPYRGEVDVVFYNLDTHKRFVSTRWGKGSFRSDWLSADGLVAITEDGGLTVPVVWNLEMNTPSLLDGREVSPGDFEVPPLMPDSQFDGARQALTGDGLTVSFTCQSSIFLFDRQTREFNEVVDDFENAPELAATERDAGRLALGLDAVVTESGNAVIFGRLAAENEGERERTHPGPGLFEAPTSPAQPLGLATPTDCR